jgi:non-ribosomal peptide synthetase component F
VQVVQASSEEAVVREVAAEAARPFDLEAEPLVRARLLVRSFAGGSGAVLALTMHHAVGDAWSQGIFWRELSAAYDAALNGRSPGWSPLPIQYGDYAAWQRDQLTGASGESLRAFWRKTLLGAPSMVQLPQDRPRPSRPTFLAGVARSSLPEGLLGKLESVARSLRVNMQAVLLAGLQAVLLRYTGQDDLVVGVPVAGRDRQETHGLVGYFINTLPVRCVAVEGASFADMVREASTATLAALDHSLLPIEEVVAASGVARVPNVNPLFQVLFQYLPDGTGRDSYTFGGGVVARLFDKMAGLSHAKMDLFFTVGKNAVLAEYMTDLFDAPTIDRLLSSFVNVLEQLVDDSRRPALSCSLLGARDALEAARLSMGVERPEYVSAPLVHDAFDAIAAAFPEHQCLYFEGEWLSYGQVAERVAIGAARLASLGVGPGVVVGVMLDRSFELVISILSVLKAGGVYLPCDPSYPDDRLQIYLEDGKAVVLLVDSQHSSRAAGFASGHSRVVDVSELQIGSAKGAVLGSVGANDPAYLIFTSGSTGRPKGVVVPHRGFRDHINGSVEFYEMNADDKALLTITINFDPHITQMFMPLILGGGLVIAKPEAHTDGEYMMDLVATTEATHFVSTPSLAMLQFAGSRAKDCTKLRSVMLCGEPLPQKAIDFLAVQVSNFLIPSFDIQTFIYCLSVLF